MLYFDLDGVLRDLCKAANFNPDSYDDKINGIDFVPFFTMRPHLQVFAPPTEYIAIALTQPKVNVITSQDAGWFPHTISWLDKNIPNLGTLIFDHEKRRLLQDHDILIEDYPKYKDYSNIIVVDRPYNRCITLPHIRVHAPEELEEELKRRQR